MEKVEINTVDEFKKRTNNANQNVARVSVSLKVDRYGNVYAAPLAKGERALTFDEVSALAASRR